MTYQLFKGTQGDADVKQPSVDIVERLRPIADYIGLYRPHCQTILEAADEIEYLRAQLQKVMYAANSTRNSRRC